MKIKQFKHHNSFLSIILIDTKLLRNKSRSNKCLEVFDAYMCNYLKFLIQNSSYKHSCTFTLLVVYLSLTLINVYYFVD